MLRLLALLALALVVEAAGVVLLSRGLKRAGGLERVGVREVLSLVKAGASEPALVSWSERGNRLPVPSTSPVARSLGR